MGNKVSNDVKEDKINLEEDREEEKIIKKSRSNTSGSIKSVKDTRESFFKRIIHTRNSFISSRQLQKNQNESIILDSDSNNNSGVMDSSYMEDQIREKSHRSSSISSSNRGYRSTPNNLRTLKYINILEKTQNNAKSRTSSFSSISNLNDSYNGSTEDNNDRNFKKADNLSENSDVKSFSTKFSIFEKQSFNNNPNFGDYLRKSYIAKLIKNNILDKNEDKIRYNNIIIFDWDDTLFPTTYLTPKGIYIERETTQEESLLFKDLELSVLKLILFAVNKGETYILTNSILKWVHYCIQNYYPKVKEVLDKVKIISSRELYEQKFPNNSKKWKLESYLNIATLTKYNKKMLTNIINISDSSSDITAVTKLSESFVNVILKTLKFKDAPNLQDLSKELKLVCKQFHLIYSGIINLSIRVGQKK